MRFSARRIAYVLAALILAIPTPVSGQGLQNDDRTPIERAYARYEGFPVVLPPIDCDVSGEWASDLIAQGYSPDGIADLFGEALVDPTGRVIVTFAC